MSTQHRPRYGGSGRTTTGADHAIARANVDELLTAIHGCTIACDEALRDGDEDDAHVMNERVRKLVVEVRKRLQTP